MAAGRFPLFLAQDCQTEKNHTGVTRIRHALHKPLLLQTVDNLGYPAPDHTEGRGKVPGRNITMIFKQTQTPQLCLVDSKKIALRPKSFMAHSVQLFHNRLKFIYFKVDALIFIKIFIHGVKYIPTPRPGQGPPGKFFIYAKHRCP